MTASIKIRQLESKISDLQTQHQHLLKERQQEIAALLSVVDLAHLDDKTLMGGLLFLKDKTATQDPILEAWRDAGEKFLRYAKPRTYPHHQPYEGKKQTEDRSQVPGKSVPPKQTVAPQTTHQSPQKPPRQREE